MLPNDAIVFLKLSRGAHELAIGSGVLYRRDGKVYIVTAWHNVTGRHSETLKPLSSVCAFPDRMTAYIACRMLGGPVSGAVRRAFDIPLEDARATFYLTHTQGFPRIDVVVIPIDPTYGYPTEHDLSDGRKVIIDLPMAYPVPADGIGVGSAISCIQDFVGSSEAFDVNFDEQLTVSEDLFILGYPKGIIDWTFQPLWKRATVATVPQMGWERQKKFLVDCASREGMSGAPVINFSRNGQFQVGGTTFLGGEPSTVFHGIYVGRVGATVEFEAQIGTVWRRAIIDEIIDSGTSAPHSTELEASPQEIREFVQAHWPTSDDYADAVMNGGRPTSWMSYDLAQKMNGRASFNDIEKMVREEAQRRCDEAEQGAKTSVSPPE